MQVILVFVSFMFFFSLFFVGSFGPGKVRQHHTIISFTWIVQKKLFANDGMFYLPHIKYNIIPRIIRMNDIADIASAWKWYKTEECIVLATSNA